MRTFLTLGTVAGLLVPGAGAVDYKSDVFPIFKEKCGKCHMAGKDKGSVRLDLDRIKGEIGMTVQPAKPVADSIIYDVVTTKERDLLMPPSGKGSPLTSREIRIVKDWIESGASISGEDVAAAGGGGDTGGASVVARTSEPEPLPGEWVNNKGQKITATLLRVTGENAILKIADGREVPYPIANLSEESRAKVRAFAEGGAAGGGVAEAGERRREKEDEREREDEDDDEKEKEDEDEKEDD